MSGQSTRGALNLTAGDNYGVLCGPQTSVYGDVPECGGPASSTATPAPTNGVLGTFVDDTDPYWDVCSQWPPAALTGRNIGDLLTAAGVTWGWFQGGFTLRQRWQVLDEPRARGVRPRRRRRSRARTRCGSTDYVPHHNPFQYYASTANPQHLPPTSVAMVGKTDQANHLYDLTWFWEAARAGNLPAVSFLKAPAYQNGHPGNSNPLDEQEFLVRTLNRLQQLPEWRSMAVIIAADDSDGWYDHVMPPIVNQSNTPLDFLCGDKSDGPGARCGYGPRLPLLVISPYARENYVSHALTDQTSILRFIEDNWLERRADQRDLVRPDRRLARRHVRLLLSRHAPAPARSRHRPANSWQKYFQRADGGSMKTAFLICCLLTLAAGTPVNAADCIKNQDGNVVCGQGQCATDQYGKVFCAKEGGGAMRDQDGKVKCGVGYCAEG